MVGNQGLRLGLFLLAVKLQKELSEESHPGGPALASRPLWLPSQGSLSATARCTGLAESALAVTPLGVRPRPTGEP